VAGGGNAHQARQLARFGGPFSSHAPRQVTTFSQTPVNEWPLDDTFNELRHGRLRAERKAEQFTVGKDPLTRLASAGTRSPTLAHDVVPPSHLDARTWAVCLPEPASGRLASIPFLTRRPGACSSLAGSSPAGHGIDKGALEGIAS
jgi:hypothetical protein